MKKLAAVFALGMLFVSGCALHVTEESYARAGRGEYVLKYPGFNASKEAMRNNIILALQSRGWVIESKDLPIKARLKKIRQEAVASFDVSGDEIVVDTKGSVVDGSRPYVPNRYVENVIVSVRKFLMKNGG